MDSAGERRLEALRRESASGEGRGAGMVPVGYAERAMNSLMALHTDLVAEKERALDLTRRLMEERQARAELDSYVRLLEAELRRLGGPDLTGGRSTDGESLERATGRLLAALSEPPPAPAPVPVNAAPPAPAPVPVPVPANVAPPAPAPANVAPPAPAPANVAPPAPVSAAPPAPAPKPRPAPEHRAVLDRRVPRPPRPSRRYRAKVTSPAAARSPAPARRTPRADDDLGWRQW